MASLPAAAAHGRPASIALRRLPLMALGVIALVTGAGAGLARLGWNMPIVAVHAAPVHGPLMIGAFLGVVIALERAVAIGRGWAMLGPALAGAGGVLAIVAPFLPGVVPSLAATAAALPIALGSGVLVAASLAVLRRQPTLFNAVIAAGAGCWVVGNALWLGGVAVADVVPWWLSFLVLTIAGERLELSRFLPPAARARALFVAIVALLLLALVVDAVAVVARTIDAARVASPAAASPTAAPLARVPLMAWSLALLALAAWLFRNDLARRTVRMQGLTRYCAVCLLSGYVWLATGASLVLGANAMALLPHAAAAGAWSPGSMLYDAGIHALALGFVFSMVFGHAPIILPAVLRITLPYTPAFYIPLVLLHASLAVRIAGDLLARFDCIRLGGLLNVLALAAFIVANVTAVLRAPAAADRRGRSAPPAPSRH
jgi:hypothetical protein